MSDLYKRVLRSEAEQANATHWRPAVHVVEPIDTDTDEPTCGICGVHVDLYADGWDHARVEE